MRRDRNCGGNYRPDAEKSFGIFDLVGLELWECPTRLVPVRIWNVLDLFWLCHSKVQSLNGMSVQRQHLPVPGGPLVQDSWTMWAFDTLVDLYGEFAHAVEETKRNAGELQKSHEENHKKGQRG